MESKVCPVCEEGVLTIMEGCNKAEYRGVKESVSFYYAECDACGSEQADAALSLKNKRLMIAFHKRVDGLLTGEEIRELRGRLKLKQSEAAQVFGGGPTAFSKYESDDVTQSAGMDKLLRVADALPEAFRYLCTLSGQAVPEGVPVLSLVNGAENVVWHTVDLSERELGSNDAFPVTDTHIISAEESYG